LKILYYISDHGLGHATRSVALIREFQKSGIKVLIRNNDASYFLKKSLPSIKIISGQTDLIPIMNLDNGARINYSKTKKNITNWIKELPKIIEHESSIIKKEKPDLVISDVSISPIMSAKQNNVKSIVLSNFIWNETLNMTIKNQFFLKNVYGKADLIMKLPFGSPITLNNKKNFGLLVRKPTKSKSHIRKILNIGKNEKLVTIALGGMSKFSFQSTNNIKILDLSNYKNKLKKLNFIEGQNIINASDLVICKCGYGFISECLAYGTKFRYLLDPLHVEANYIHKSLKKEGLDNNMFTFSELKKLKISNDLISNTKSLKIKSDNIHIKNTILKLI
jgi:UDP-N-acetylglucosamine:LPS N-acetylglucosamine transferase